MRNPENVDLSKYPPPPGYVVASEEDIKKSGRFPGAGWMFFCSRCKEWEQSKWPIQNHWTYLRPITPEDQGDKYDTDHMFWG